MAKEEGQIDMSRLVSVPWRVVFLVCVAVCCSVLQCVAVCCSVLQCVAVCCSVSSFSVKHDSVHDDALQDMTTYRIVIIVCVAVCCSVLQCVVPGWSAMTLFCVCATCVAYHGTHINAANAFVLGGAGWSAMTPFRACATWAAFICVPCYVPRTCKCDKCIYFRRRGLECHDSFLSVRHMCRNSMCAMLRRTHI